MFSRVLEGEWEIVYGWASLLQRDWTTLWFYDAAFAVSFWGEISCSGWRNFWEKLFLVVLEMEHLWQWESVFLWSVYDFLEWMMCLIALNVTGWLLLVIWIIQLTTEATPVYNTRFLKVILNNMGRWNYSSRNAVLIIAIKFILWLNQ